MEKTWSQTQGKRTNESSEQGIHQNIIYSYENSTFFCKQCGYQSSESLSNMLVNTGQDNYVIYSSLI